MWATSEAVTPPPPCSVAIGTTSAHSNSSRRTSWVGVIRCRPSCSIARLPSPVRPRRSNSTTCGAIAAPATSVAAATAPHMFGSTGNGTRPPRRVACQGDAAPGPTMLQRSVDTVVDRGNHRRRGIVGVQQRERRIREGTDRDDRQSQQSPERTRYVRSHDGCVPQRAHPCAGAKPDATRNRLDFEQRRAEASSRFGHDIFIGNRRACRARAVHLETAAHDDVFEAARAGRCAQRRDRAQLRALVCRGRRHTRRGFVHSEVRDDRRREILHEPGEPVAVARVDAAELGLAKPAPWRHEVDPDDFVGPRPLLHQLGDAGSQLSAHARDENAIRAHRPTGSDRR